MPVVSECSCHVEDAIFPDESIVAEFCKTTGKADYPVQVDGVSKDDTPFPPLPLTALFFFDAIAYSLDISRDCHTQSDRVI